MNTVTGRVDPRAYIRTYVPLLVGMLLGWLVTTFTVVADLLRQLDEILVAAGAGVNAKGLLDALAIALVTVAYYWIARQLGRRWPQLERFLLGSAAIPVYGASQAELTPWNEPPYTDTDTEGR